MGCYIVIDGGTTTTRIGVYKNGKILNRIKLPLGARINMEKPDSLNAAVRKGIEKLLLENPCEPECIIAAGMITSEFGLYNLPHTALPAGIAELSAAAKMVSLPDICAIPFCFVAGVKTCSDLEKTDMMRGEECEIFGLAQTDGTYVLPGSHSKVITLKNGKIEGFKTLLSGEMAAALAGSTILRDAVDFSATLDEEWLLKGYQYCKKNGLNEALFKVRILDKLLNATKAQSYSFFLGAVLEGEIRTILSADDAVFVAGKKELRDATIILLQHEGISASAIGDEASEGSVFLGMIKIYEHKKSRD